MGFFQKKHQFRLGSGFGDQFLKVIDQQSIALAMDLSEAGHVIGLDPTLEGSTEFRTAGESQLAVVLIARPTP